VSRVLDPAYRPSSVQALRLDPRAADYEFTSAGRAASSYDRVLEAVPPHATRVLELGCGSGRLTGRIAAALGRVDETSSVGRRDDGIRAVGLDRSQTLLSLARDRHRHARGPAWIAGDMRGLPFADESFDVVISGRALRLTDLPLALTEIARVLRPGGLALLQDQMLPSIGPGRVLYRQVRRTVRQFPSMVRMYGLVTTVTIVADRMSWSRLDVFARGHYRQRDRARPVYERSLPGCSISIHREQVRVTWQKPGDA